ncbi:hypothetical protein M1P56_01990 [Streptomyces sp. HU2014]|uniref:hypothetical protein n=1 Tax=Streptomyces sp. HU2014 TaxID=2939414 RepID=UPI00200CD811|nr:hypothetical protein [Streptomyces sp. HU2014]UQI43240.1 hypothetical protein M1P56_01990 [Streptomyces sp. HU2014]
MKSRALRLVPAAALTAGLLLAGASGAAVATPSEASPSATASPGGTSDNQLTRASWTTRGEYYHDKRCCQDAGKHGKHHGDWHEYKCEQHGHWWWLRTK